MASWPPLSQKINYLLASQSIVWYLLRKITDIDTYNYHRYRHRYRYRTGIGPSLIITINCGIDNQTVVLSLVSS